MSVSGSVSRARKRRKSPIKCRAIGRLLSDCVPRALAWVILYRADTPGDRGLVLMDRFFIAAGAAMAFLGVTAGAFAAHGLRQHLGEAMLAVFQTGAHYQLIHALGLILIGSLLQGRLSGPWLRVAGWLLLGGIVLFSFSLYLLAVTGIGALGLITPFGGLALLAGWGCLLAAAWRGGGETDISV